MEIVLKSLEQLTSEIIWVTRISNETVFLKSKCDVTHKTPIFIFSSFKYKKL